MTTSSSTIQTLLPGLLQTPAGLAIIEIQGTIHLPSSDDSNHTEVGRLEFPLYDRTIHNDEEGTWMKKARLYIGKHQVLNGEVKKLGKPLAVLAKDPVSQPFKFADGSSESDVTQREQLGILSVVFYKVIFSSRPEPVGQPQLVTNMPSNT